MIRAATVTDRLEVLDSRISSLRGSILGLHSLIHGAETTASQCSKGCQHVMQELGYVQSGLDDLTTTINEG